MMIVRLLLVGDLLFHFLFFIVCFADCNFLLELRFKTMARLAGVKFQPGGLDSLSSVGGGGAKQKSEIIDFTAMALRPASSPLCSYDVIIK
jgi:hypothetical protein